MEIESELKMKVLISMVGNRDPYPPSDQTGVQSEGSILTLYRHLRPQIVFLFPTLAQLGEKTSNTQINAEKTKNEIVRLDPETKVFQDPLDLPDPTDYKDILHKTEQKITSIREQVQRGFGSKADYHLNISSGTPQMQACWLLLVNGGRLKARVWQVIAPQWLEIPEARCRLVEMEFVEEQNRISRAQNFFSDYYFRAAQDELELLAASTYIPERAFLAEIMAKICEAYYIWDLFEHKKAKELLTEVSKNLTRIPTVSKLINKIRFQIDILDLILSSGDKENKTNLVDLFHNAQRRKKAKQYVDCLARFKRLYEGCQNLFIRNELQIEPTQKFKNQPQWVKDIIHKNPEANLGMPDWDKVLEYKKKKFPIHNYLNKEVRDYNEKRNRSIVGHGMGSISEEDAKSAMNLARCIMQSFFENADLEKYSFGEAELKNIENLIFRVL